MGDLYYPLKCSSIADYVAWTVDFTVLGHGPCVFSWEWGICVECSYFGFMCTMRTAVQLHKCIVTNRCLVPQMSCMVTTSYLDLNHTLQWLTGGPEQCFNTSIGQLAFPLRITSLCALLICLLLVCIYVLVMSWRWKKIFFLSVHAACWVRNWKETKRDGNPAQHSHERNVV